MRKRCRKRDIFGVVSAQKHGFKPNAFTADYNVERTALGRAFEVLYLSASGIHARTAVEKVCAICRYNRLAFGEGKNFALGLYDIFHRAEAFEVLGAYARYNGIVGRADFAQLCNVAYVARAHFRNKNIVVGKVIIVERKRKPHRRIVRAGRGQHAVLCAENLRKNLLCAGFAVAARYAHYLYRRGLQFAGCFFYKAFIVRHLVNF